MCSIWKVECCGDARLCSEGRTDYRRRRPRWCSRCDAGFGAVLVGALASVFMTCAASADVRIVDDPGGKVSSYVQKYRELRTTGEHVVIDGPCLSACTLLTGILPRKRVCVTRRAKLGFHAASYYDDASRSLVPTREGSRIVMRHYPAQIRSWIDRQGGLKPQLFMLHGPELASFYRTCQ